MAKKKSFYGYHIVSAGFVIWLISGGSFSTFSIFFLPISNEFGWSRAEISLAMSMSSIVSGVLALGTGWLTDRLGPRLVITVFGSFLGISALLTAMVSELWQFQLNYALVNALGTSIIFAPMMATIARWFIKKRSMMTGIVQTGLGFSGFIFAPLASWLILSYGWRTAYVVIGIICLIGVIVPGLFFRRDPHEMGQLPDGESVEMAPAVARPKPPGSLNLKQALATSQFWVLAGLFFAFGFCRSTFIAHIVPHVQDLGFTLSDGANIMAVITISSILGRVGIGKLADVIGSRPALVIAYAVTTADMVWGMMTTQLWGLYIYAFVFGFSWGAQAVVRFSATAEAFGLRSAGVVMAALGMAENTVAAALGVWLAGYLFDITGTYSIIYIIGLVISIGGVILAAMVKPVARPEIAPGNLSPAR